MEKDSNMKFTGPFAIHYAASMATALIHIVLSCTKICNKW